MPYFVYALTEPYTDVVTYIGVTNNTEVRLYQHILRDGKNAAKDAWVQQLLERGLEPCLSILDTVETKRIAHSRERYWINHYLAQQVPLLNITLNANRYPNRKRKTLIMKKKRLYLTSEDMTTKNRQQTIRINEQLYYTAQKAQEVLGMSYSGLKYQVLIGNIRTEIPRGRKQSYYRTEDVEQVARDLKTFSLHRKNKPTQFVGVKTIEDMRECMEVSKALFGAERGDIAKHMKILDKNPETYYMIKDEDQTIGYTAIWPLKPGKLNSILAQTIPVKVSPEDIETFESGKTIDIYLNVIGVKPTFTREEKRSYGARLVSGLLQVIENLGERGVPIGIIGARSNMPEGIRLMRGLGFTEIEPLTPERKTFIINVKESGIHFVMKYKEKLRKWQEDRTQLYQ